MNIKAYVDEFTTATTMLKVTLPIIINGTRFELPLVTNIKQEAFKQTDIYEWDLDVIYTNAYASQLELTLEPQTITVDVNPDPVPDPEPQEEQEENNVPL